MVTDYKGKVKSLMTYTKKWEEPVCECGGILDFEDDFYLCVNPDCAIVCVSVAEVQGYIHSGHAVNAITTYTTLDGLG